MEIKPEDLIQRLKQHKELPGSPRIILAIGNENYYRSEITKYIPDYVFDGIASEDREINYFEKDTNLSELEAVINTYPFFSGLSLVILRDEKLWKIDKYKVSEAKKKQLDELAKILSDVPDYCTILILAQSMDKRMKLFKSLKEHALITNCESIKVRDIAPWLNAKAEELGGRFDYDAIPAIMDYLAATDEAPLALLTQEITKLAVYAGERKKWSKHDVETIFSALPEAAYYALNNFIADKKLVEALTLLADEKKKGKHILLLCGGVQAQLRKMLRIKELAKQGYDQKNIAAELKLHPFVVKMTMQQCRKFSDEALLNALMAIGDLNKGLRKGGRDFELLEEILVKLLT
ncbi:MAG: DNA polymerase III subunit delta [Phascolarctobacterium sp.]|nr:DNA polymerase III subunit delta [Phascolarctobacterium sp.]